MCEEQQSAIVRSWGHHSVGDGVSMALYRNPDRLVIEIHAPMDLLDLNDFLKPARTSAQTGDTGGH